MARIGIITVSDRASRGEYEDKGGPAIQSYLENILTSPWCTETRLIPDEIDLVEQTIIDLCDVQNCCLVILTGGTGPAPRDVSPDALENTCPRLMPGFGERMRQVSLQYVPTAILSRQNAGIRGSSLVITLPGKPAAISQCLDAVFESVPYCIQLIGGPTLQTDPEKLRAFQPKS